MLFLNVVFKTNKNNYLPAFVLSVLFNVFSWHLPFFWDTILTSTITQHFFENGFGNFITPAHLDAGHPPLFYIYLTGLYHLFGKTLFTAHLSLFPFIVIASFSLIELLEYFKFSSKNILLGVLLLFCIPAVSSQFLMVSYDVVLLSMYLLALTSYLNGRKFVFALAVFIMGAVSLRGLFCWVSLSITILLLERKNWMRWIKWNMFFIPGLIVMGGWYMYHYSQTGWWVSTNASGWSSQRGVVDFNGFIKNGISICRILVDVGIVLLSIISVFRIFSSRKMSSLTLIWLIPFVTLSIGLIPFSNPVNHRYFLIVFVLMLPSVLSFLAVRKSRYTILVVLGLLLGNFQLYPIPISNAWDCTLVHLSYFKLRNSMDKKIDNLNIPTEQIGTVFPMNTSKYQTTMTGAKERCVNMHGKSIDTIPYILFCTVGNDFSDEQLEQISDWNKLLYERNGQLSMILYQNPKNSMRID